MKFEFIFLIFLLLTISSNIVFAQPYSQPAYDISRWLGDFCTMTLGVSAQFCRWPDIFWLLILPYFSTLVIIFGLMEEIGILRHAEHRTTIYFLIALGWAMLLVPTGFLGYIATWLYSIGAITSIIAFVTVFIIGVAFWWWTGWRRWGKGGYEYTILEAKKRRIEQLTRMIENYTRRYTAEIRKRNPDWNRARRIRQEIDRLERIRNRIEREI